MTPDEKQIIEAIVAGDIEKVRDLIEKDIFLADARAEDGTSALLTAIYHGEEEIALVILDSGPTLTIHEAAAAGDEERLVELLIDDPSVVNSVSHDGWTPLHLAVYFNKDRIAEHLVASGADISVLSQNQMGVSPLHSALSNRNARIARVLLHHGADPVAPSAPGYTPLHYAAANDLVEVLTMLIEMGAPTDVKSNDGRTPLDLAREKGSVRAVEALEERMKDEG